MNKPVETNKTQQANREKRRKTKQLNVQDDKQEISKSNTKKEKPLSLK